MDEQVARPINSELLRITHIVENKGRTHRKARDISNQINNNAIYRERQHNTIMLSYITTVQRQKLPSAMVKSGPMSMPPSIPLVMPASVPVSLPAKAPLTSLSRWASSPQCNTIRHSSFPML